MERMEDGKKERSERTGRTGLEDNSRTSRRTAWPGAWDRSPSPSSQPGKGRPTANQSKLAAKAMFFKSPGLSRSQLCGGSGDPGTPLLEPLSFMIRGIKERWRGTCWIDAVYECCSSFYLSNNE